MSGCGVQLCVRSFSLPCATCMEPMLPHFLLNRSSHYLPCTQPDLFFLTSLPMQARLWWPPPAWRPCWAIQPWRCTQRTPGKLGSGCVLWVSVLQLANVLGNTAVAVHPEDPRYAWVELLGVLMALAKVSLACHTSTCTASMWCPPSRYPITWQAVTTLHFLPTLQLRAPARQARGAPGERPPHPHHLRRRAGGHVLWYR